MVWNQWLELLFRGKYTVKPCVHSAEKPWHEAYIVGEHRSHDVAVEHAKRMFTDGRAAVSLTGGPSEQLHLWLRQIVLWDTMWCPSENTVSNGYSFCDKSIWREGFYGLCTRHSSDKHSRETSWWFQSNIASLILFQSDVHMWISLE